MELRAYECNVKGTNWHQIIHATSRGRAKAEYLRDVREAWQDTLYTAITARCIGAPVQTAEFQRVAAHRGLPEARIGQRVRVGGDLGYIVGANTSANFNVLFSEGQFAGQTLNCHPQHQMELVSDATKETAG